MTNETKQDEFCPDTEENQSAAPVNKTISLGEGVGVTAVLNGFCRHYGLPLVGTVDSTGASK